MRGRHYNQHHHRVEFSVSEGSDGDESERRGSLLELNNTLSTGRLSAAVGDSLQYRESVGEQLVQREAKFYNYLWASSDAFNHPLSSPISQMSYSTVKSQVDVSTVASNTHLLGGDGSFFARPELLHQRRGVEVNEAPISMKYVLKLFGNERSFSVMDETRNEKSVTKAANTHRLAVRGKLQKALSFLLTEPYQTTLAEYLRKQQYVSCLDLSHWIHCIAFQLKEMHRAGVAHSYINTNSIVLCDAPLGEQRPLVAKLSWLFCATMMDLRLVVGLRKQTLSECRQDPKQCELHALSTDLFPPAVTQVGELYQSLPPEWFSSPPLSAHEKKKSSRHAFNQQLPKLLPQVFPTEKSDSYLLGKLVQLLFTKTLGEFNPAQVFSLTTYYASSIDRDVEGCPSTHGALNEVDKVCMESLRHFICAATHPDPSKRWGVDVLMSHPFFWSPQCIVEFVTALVEFAFPSATDVSEALEADKSRRQSLRDLAEVGQTVQKKVNLTATEIVSKKNISRTLAEWIVDNRRWMSYTNDWRDTLIADGTPNLRYNYDNILQDQVDFFLNTYNFINKHHHQNICGGDADRFVVEFFHRRFPMLLMEGIVTVSQKDCEGFLRHIAKKTRNMMNRTRHGFLVSIAAFFTALKGEDLESLKYAGQDKVVTGPDGIIRFPVMTTAPNEAGPLSSRANQL